MSRYVHLSNILCLDTDKRQNIAKISKEKQKKQNLDLDIILGGGGVTFSKL